MMECLAWEAAHLKADRKQREWKIIGTRLNFQRHALSLLLPPALLKMGLLPGDQTFHI